MGRDVLEILERLGGERRIHYALDHFKEALREAGSPEQNVKSIVIAGTNGKGSTTLFISSALRAHGYSVATYLSPHLEHPRERFLHNLIPIDSSTLDRLAVKFETLADKHQLTYFEFLTLLYFVWASELKVDYMVLEVGLGGRLDATNVTTPLACALTNISFDHQAYLGNTLEAILNEKIAVVPKVGKLFTGIRETALLKNVKAYCQENSIVLKQASAIESQSEKRSWQGQTAFIDGKRFEFVNPGAVTVENAAVAYLLLRDTFPEVSIKEIQRGFLEMKNPGRFEVMQNNPRVILSGDHNPAGIQSLKETLKLLPQTKLHTVCAFSPDKPYQEMFSELKGLSSDITLTQVTKLRGALPPEYSSITDHFERDPVMAVKKMLAKCPDDATVLVTGSLYLIGEIRGIWKN